MKKVFLLMFLSLFFMGCEKISEEIITEETTVTRREPYPIMRTYNNTDGYIEFTDTTSSIELKRIYYNNYDSATGSGIEDQITVKVPENCSGNIVTLQVRAKSYSWTCYDNNVHTVAFNMKEGTEFPDFRYLGLTEDVLDANNQYDFVRLLVGNVIYEMYYLGDFE